MDIRKKYDDIGKKKNTLPSLANAIEKSWGVGPYNIGNINGSRSTITPTPSIAGAVSGAAPRNYSTTGPTAAVTGAITGAIPRTPSGLSPDAVLAGAIRGGAGISFLPTDTGRGGASSGGSYGSNQQVTLPASIDELPTYNSEYMDTLNELAKQLISMNYDDWTKGSQYQALADRYGNNGRMSMQDVLGQVASRTGGLASSYATTAAQQQYNQYMAQLEEVARKMYSQDRSDLLDNANLYRNLANDEYDRYRDSLADYNAQKAAAKQAANNAYQNSTWEDRGSTPESRTNLAGFASTGAKESVGNVTGLNYSQDEGVFTWNGKDYGSTSRLLQDIENAGLSKTEKNTLKKKFRNYGFDFSF